MTVNLFFTPAWNKQFVTQWNLAANFPKSSYFMNLGSIVFVIEENKKRIQVSSLYWDETGKVHTLQKARDQEEQRIFAAPFHVWKSIIDKEYSPVYAVANKLMKFEGDIRFGLQFSQYFKYIAEVAADVNSSF